MSADLSRVPASPWREGAVVVEPVRGRRDLTAFVRFPYRLHRDDVDWVPPWERERRAFLDRRRNPFFDYGDVELYLARRGGEVVGRVAAVDNPRHNDFHGTRHGFFGLFDCVDDVEVAGALFAAAAGWLRRRGLDAVLGPTDFSTNRECGLLVDGFGSPPAILMPHNPPYYPALLEACGFAKAKDLWAWDLDVARGLPERTARVADAVLRRAGVSVRPVDLGDFAGEVERVRELYNASWARNWGFVPMTDREFRCLAAELRRVVRPELALVAEVGGEPVGFGLSLPDMNQALRAVGGRLGRYGSPGAWLRLWRAARRVRRVRILALGVREGYRGRGVDVALTVGMVRAARRLGYTDGEVSWTLEDNRAANRVAEYLGATRSRTYRIYQRPLGGEG
ncbi:hypothetical protein LX15_005205 [Streptoalloteichus tenebrarius]|uniref:N-acetyltransferase domain-containing protein n=1 Tax=Streptoalloteichus tenebrarius (strain ATCC 17920 / DSM 40477 / JCM 4838 / CBS 697.72 / NBRC 16177 / NCIMB 11028 / NRRL B-12390 / A12253. 1 / ISP 5477) TaxID=1933 RepID=A0ABT1I109_STRSD|nr:GNAT family N-acetyltransferase [Streptoalloteichus tenebrarius]MCP2261479.1 hypothetical protein [Streptoalloteichus tenebrarius]BFE99715.1 hypothetical protein GCM10020241_13910 [Streptoalloteichus tenebrarius]